jgi:hypothetical protein
MFILDPVSEFFPSREYFNTKKWFLSSRKCDPGWSSRIRILTFYPFRIPDPGVKKAPDPGSGSATLLKIAEKKVPPLFSLLAQDTGPGLGCN